jgi:hypothetical protein
MNSPSPETTDRARSRARRAIAIYAAFVGVAWLLAWLLKGDNEGLSSIILTVALLPSILLALPVILTTTIENSVVASGILIAAGALNAFALYRFVRWRSRTNSS